MIRFALFDKYTNEFCSIETVIEKISPLHEMFTIKEVDIDPSLQYKFILNGSDVCIVEDTEAIIANAKLKKIDELNYLYNLALTVRVHNGIDFSFNLKDETGSALLSIVSKAEGSFDDISIASKVQHFFVSETLPNGRVEQHQTKMLNWLWLYIFGELPELYRKLKQKLELYTILINSCANLDDLASIKIDFHVKEGLVLSIPEIMRYILSNNYDIIKGVRVEIPGYVKAAIKAVSRELFSESSLQEIESSIESTISDSFLKVIS